MKVGDGKPRSKVRRARRKIEFRVTDDQYEQLQIQAKEADLNGPNAFASAATFAANGCDMRRKRQMIGELGRIGADLRTYTQHAKSRGDPISAHKVEKAAEAVVSFLRDIVGPS